MKKGRLEAFSDGVMAIIITIMVLELKVPHEPNIDALIPLIPVFISYFLSFLFIAIYWNNHHHLFQAVQKVNGPTLWANMHLLFWLSLVPFVTGWMGENHFSPWTVALYGADMLLAGIAYFILTKTLIAHHGKESSIARAIGNDFKSKISLVVYIIGTSLSFYNSWISLSLYFLVSLMWLVPDKRIENTLLDNN